MLDLALDIRRGSFHLQLECRFAAPWTVLFGPSGAGKSTLLRALAGLHLNESPSRGQTRIVLDGQTLTDSSRRVRIKPGRRQTALVAQHPALFPHLTVAANVAYGLSHLDSRAGTARVEETLNLVGAASLIDRNPRDLSGGESQRVALARALAPHPRLLLLDEPFSALDGAASDALLARLQQWTAANNVQTIMATHDATDALAAQADVALLKDGRLVAQGPAAQVLASERQRLKERLSL